MKTAHALLVVDAQNDFFPGGALAVPEGDKIIETLNCYIGFFVKNHWPVFLSRDWHPEKTSHFKMYGGPWPAHCVENTPGARFHPDLKLPARAVILSKGMDPDAQSYSAFQASDADGRFFLEILKADGISELFIGGLATDYCVKATVLDAVRCFKVHVLVDAIRGVDVHPGDSKAALDEMAAAGAEPMVFSDFNITEH